MNVLEPFNILDYLDKIEVVDDRHRDAYHCLCPVCGDGGFKIDKRSDPPKYNTFKCGCPLDKVREVLRPIKDAFEEVAPQKQPKPFGVRKYEYRNWSGERLAAVKREDTGSGEKTFKQGHWNGTEYKPGLPKEVRADIALYRWADVQKAIADGEPFLFWVEGEDCADALWRIGCPATTTIGGSGGYTNYGSYKGKIEGIQVVICPDMDEVGLKYASQVYQDYPNAFWLYAFPDAVQWRKISTGNGVDVEDWLATGITREQLLEAIEFSPRLDKPEPQNISATELRKAVSDYAAITDPFQQVIASKDISKTYGVGGKALDELTRVVKAPENACSVPLADVMAGVYGQIERRAAGEVPPGITSGFCDIDAVTCGFQPSDLVIVAGRPSMGKTALAMSFALNASQTTPDPVVVFSLETSKDQLVYRWLSNMMGITFGSLRTGGLVNEQWDDLTNAIGTLCSLPIIVNDASGMTVDLINRELRKLDRKPAMVVIDYLQLMDGPGENPVVRTGNISRGLKSIAREYNCPVIALSQLSRAVEGNADKRPMMSHLRDSGSIEQDADLVMLLYRDEYYNKDSPDKGIAEVIIAKHRNGPVGTVKLLFEPQFTRFKNLTSGLNGGLRERY